MDEAWKTHDGDGNPKGRDRSGDGDLRGKIKCNLS